MGMTVRFGTGSELRVVLKDAAPRRFFLNCRRCKAVQVVDFALYQTVVPGRPATLKDDWAIVVDGRIFFVSTYCQLHERCECGGRIEATELDATVSPDHICNDKCVSATRNVCGCSCGGANHGGKHLVAA